MTKAQMRVKIAKDVIKHLDITNVSTGWFMQGVRFLPIHSADNAQPHINTLTKNCLVCALGACMLSHVRLFNEATIGELVEFTDNPLHSKLNNYFTKTQLVKIEEVFECRKNSDYLYDLSHKERLRYIMKSIIKNKGRVIV